MLQQGRYVADVAYFIGEDAPQDDGVYVILHCQKAILLIISMQMFIKQRISVQNGMLVLPNGITYRMLVLPKTYQHAP